MQPNAAIQILRRITLQGKIDLSRASIYNKLNPKHPQYDPTFPKPIKLGANTVGWLEHEVDAWILARVEQSRKAA